MNIHEERINIMVVLLFTGTYNWCAGFRWRFPSNDQFQWGDEWPRRVQDT